MMGDDTDRSGRLDRNFSDSMMAMETTDFAATDVDMFDERKEPNRVHVPITLCLIILTSYISGGGVLFSLWEGWDYLDGCYFCFVTLSTIGRSLEVLNYV